MGTKQVVKHGLSALTVPALSGHRGLTNLCVINIAIGDSIQPQQILVDCAVFLPLLDYHHSYLVIHPRADLGSKIDMCHAANVLVVNPSPYELVQSCEDEGQGLGTFSLTQKQVLDLGLQFFFGLVCGLAFPTFTALPKCKF